MLMRSIDLEGNLIKKYLHIKIEEISTLKWKKSASYYRKTRAPIKCPSS